MKVLFLSLVYKKKFKKLYFNSIVKGSLACTLSLLSRFSIGFVNSVRTPILSSKIFEIFEPEANLVANSEKGSFFFGSDIIR